MVNVPVTECVLFWQTGEIWEIQVDRRQVRAARGSWERKVKNSSE